MLRFASIRHCSMRTIGPAWAWADRFRDECKSRILAIDTNEQRTFESQPPISYTHAHLLSIRPTPTYLAFLDKLHTLNTQQPHPVKSNLCIAHATSSHQSYFLAILTFLHLNPPITVCRNYICAQTFTQARISCSVAVPTAGITPSSTIWLGHLYKPGYPQQLRMGIICEELVVGQLPTPDSALE